VINDEFLGSAMVTDASTIKIRIPKDFREENRVPEFISKIEQMEFHSDEKAKVVFNERTGTIVIGQNVKVSKVAICHGNITVNIKRTMGVSQPNAFSYRGNTEVINDEQTNVIEDVADIKVIENTTTVGELAQVLNDLGVSSRDIMVIFHVLKEAGALHAELEAM
jgi:flagellar P-ring protein precursor FlgI